MPVTRFDVARSLRRAFDDRENRALALRPSRVVGRDTDGRTLLLDLSGECVQADGSQGYDGEIVVQLPGLLNRQGTAGVPLLSRRDVAALLWVESISPDEFPAGAAALEVTVIGGGFTPATVFEFLLPASEEVNPDITVTATTFIDVNTMTLTLAVAAGAARIVQAPLAFDDPTRRL